MALQQTRLLTCWSLVDVVFTRDHRIIYDDHSGNCLFRRLVHDYKRLYRSSLETEDREVVVAEVVRIWRSREPPGRFLESTHPTTSKFPLHDIGDDEARIRTTQLLGGGSKAKKVKPRDDVTASTADSSTLHNTRENTIAGRPRRGTPLECFGGSFRGLVMHFFAGSNDPIMNQYLP